jgi:integrase
MGVQQYLQRTASGYRFRRGVPKELQVALGKTEYIVSLKTHDRKEAKKRDWQAAIDCEATFERARAGNELTAAQADGMLAEWLHREIDKISEAYSGATEEQAELHQAATDTIVDCLERLDAARVWRRWPPEVRRVVEEVVAAHGTTIAVDSAPYNRIALSATNALMDLHHAQLALIEGHPLHRNGPLGAARQTVAPAAVPTRVNAGPKISDLATKWLAEAGQDAAPKTRGEWQVSVRRFIELKGDMVADAVTPLDAREYKEAWQALPTAMPKAHRKLTLPALVAIYGNNETPKLSAPTVKKAIGALSSIYTWACANGLAVANPFKGFQFRTAKKSGKKRKKFEPDDLTLIFTSPVYTSDLRPRGGRGEAAYWLPLLALFAGARLEEMAQATLEDIRHIDGVDYLSINDEGADKRTKTASAPRSVPLHPELLRLGFLEYVNVLRGSSEKRLFPLLEQNAHLKWSAQWSKWWNRYHREIGLSDKRKVFHSFRHTFIDACRRTGVPEEIRNAMVGHADSGSGKFYGDGFAAMPVEVFAEISKVSYPAFSALALKQR